MSHKAISQMFAITQRQPLDAWYIRIDRHFILGRRQHEVPHNTRQSSIANLSTIRQIDLFQTAASLRDLADSLSRNVPHRLHFPDRKVWSDGPDEIQEPGIANVEAV